MSYKVQYQIRIATPGGTLSTAEVNRFFLPLRCSELQFQIRGERPEAGLVKH